MNPLHNWSQPTPHPPHKGGGWGGGVSFQNFPKQVEGRSEFSHKKGGVGKIGYCSN